VTSPKVLVKQISLDKNPDSEPSLKVGMTASTVVGVVILIISGVFHKQLSAETQTTIYGIAVLFIPLVVSWLIRAKVWSPASVKKVIDEVTQEPPKQTPPIIL
jgi:hypothetical protein